MDQVQHTINLLQNQVWALLILNGLILAMLFLATRQVRQLIAALQGLIDATHKEGLRSRVKDLISKVDKLLHKLTKNQ